ncbi:uncharacterized protein LOC142234829 [Haematobia irritans]|uniref:uncharacterized protein LOC142234829 n=1 Tax=Haematobia irritans TaxID=7368 RepID=UPI003F500E22
MAKLETSAIKKPKAKKRKNPNPEHEDEAADKSVILEATTNNQDFNEELKKKSKKRKHKEKDIVKEKRSRIIEGTANDSNHEEDEQNDNDEDVMEMPTLEQLKESEKPENNCAIVTGRQKKRQKHQKHVEAQKGQSIDREKQRNEEYLTKWKNSREEWKFEKLRQISIQQTMLDEHMMNDIIWATALEYLSGSKGAAREKIIKIANDVIEDIDKQCEDKEDESQKLAMVNSTKYQRARDLLQIFD